MPTIPNPLVFNTKRRQKPRKDESPAPVDDEEAARAHENQSSPSDLVKPDGKSD